MELYDSQSFNVLVPAVARCNEETNKWLVYVLERRKREECARARTWGKDGFIALGKTLDIRQVLILFCCPSRGINAAFEVRSSVSFLPPPPPFLFLTSLFYFFIFFSFSIHWRGERRMAAPGSRQIKSRRYEVCIDLLYPVARAQRLRRNPERSRRKIVRVKI